MTRHGDSQAFGSTAIWSTVHSQPPAELATRGRTERAWESFRAEARNGSFAN